MKKPIKIISTALLLQCLVACGGGQSNEPEPEPPANNAPTVSVEFTEILAGQPFSTAISTFDADGDALTLTIENQPLWLSLNQQSQMLTGTPQASDAGLYTDIRIQVSDGIATTEFLFDLTIVSGEAPDNQAPTIALEGPVVLAGKYSQFTPEINDADGDMLSLALDNAPSWLQIDAVQNLLYGTPQTSDEGIFSDIRLTVSDGYKSAQINFDIEVTLPEPLPAMSSCE